MDNDTEQHAVTETYLVVEGTPLRINLNPEAIREMREGDEEDSLAGFTDADLALIASRMLYHDDVWDALHNALDAEILYFRSED